MKTGVNKLIHMKHLALFTAIFMATFFGLVITTTHAFNDPPNLRANVVFSFEEVSGYNPNLTIPQQGNKIIHYVVHANNLGPGSVTVKKEGSTNPISGWQATGEGNAEELVTVGGKTVYQEGESGVTDFYYDTAQRSCGRVQIDIGFKDTENTADRLAGDQMVTGIVINYGVDCSTLPQGYLDGASCTHIGGWSIDFDTPNSFVNIEIYRNGPFGTGTLSTTTSAYHFRSDINSIYNLGNHAFGITTPSDFLDGNSHSVYAYGIDTQTGARVLLSPSSTTTPLVISCPNTPVSPTVDLKANGSDGPITIPSGTSATLSWISQNATSCALFINNINTGWTGTSQSDVQTGNITIATSTYRVDCTGSGGNASDTVVIYTQTQTPISTLPQGYLDGASCTHIGGWSIDFDTPNSFVNIEIYRNGPFGTGTLYTTTSAYHFRSDINSIYNLGNHAFGITTPSDFLDGNSHSVYAYGIDTQTGARVLLSPSSTTTPLVISCPSTPVSPTVDLKANGSDGPITIPSGTSATLSWISQNATSCALFINNINTGWTGTSQSDVQTGNITIATSTYRVDCTGSGGNASDTVVIYTQTQTPISTLPQGYLDGASCTHIGGWSIDFDTPNSFVNIEIYRNGPFGTGTLSTTTSAYHFRSDINSIYNLGNHAFGITTPSDFLDGNSHSVYAYGIDTQTGARVLLSPSSTTTPLVISCPSTPVSPTVDLKANGSDGPITIPSGTSATLS